MKVRVKKVRVASGYPHLLRIANTADRGDALHLGETLQAAPPGLSRGTRHDDGLHVPVSERSLRLLADGRECRCADRKFTPTERRGERPGEAERRGRGGDRYTRGDSKRLHEVDGGEHDVCEGGSELEGGAEGSEVRVQTAAASLAGGKTGHHDYLAWNIVRYSLSRSRAPPLPLRAARARRPQKAAHEDD